jgi:hypothetical protein
MRGALPWTLLQLRLQLQALDVLRQRCETVWVLGEVITGQGEWFAVLECAAECVPCP